MANTANVTESMQDGARGAWIILGILRNALKLSKTDKDNGDSTMMDFTEKSFIPIINR